MARTESSRGFSLAFGGCFGIVFAGVVMVVGLMFVGSCIKDMGDTMTADSDQSPGEPNHSAAVAVSVVGVGDTSFSREEYGRLTMRLTVQNTSTVPLSRVDFHGVLASPGRALPWVEHNLFYEIPGGLEPGEVATWNFSPNRYGPWGKAPTDRSDMVLTLTPTGIYGVDGELITTPPARPTDKPPQSSPDTATR
jgi:hypothetical protein